MSPTQLVVFFCFSVVRLSRRSTLTSLLPCTKNRQRFVSGSIPRNDVQLLPLSYDAVTLRLIGGGTG